MRVLLCVSAPAILSERRWSMKALNRTFLAGVAGLLAVAFPGPSTAQLSLTVDRTMWVSATGTPEENCTVLRNVLDSIPGPASLENAYLVNVGPGRYACGTNTVRVPSFVAVEGAGAEVTEIRGNRNSPTSGVVTFDQMSGFAELRSLTVRHLGGAINHAIAVRVEAPAEVRLENVVLRSPAGPTNSSALAAAEGLAGSVFVIVRNSGLFAPTAAKAIGDATIQLLSTKISGTLTETSSGSIECASSFTDALVPLDSTCSP